MPESIVPQRALSTADGVTSMTAPVTVGNSNAETVLLSYAIPANSLISGSTYNFMLTGFGGSTAQVLTLRMRYGGVAGVLLSTIAITCAATTSPQGFWIEFTATCRTNGSSGTAYSQGWFINELATAITAQLKMSENNAAAATINTTTQNDIVVTAQWTTAAAGATITATNGYVLMVRA